MPGEMPGSTVFDTKSTLGREAFSHNLRTPLTVAKGRLQILQRHVDKLSPAERRKRLVEIQEALELVERAIESMEPLIPEAKGREIHLDD